MVAKGNEYFNQRAWKGMVAGLEVRRHWWFRASRSVLKLVYDHGSTIVSD